MSNYRGHFSKLGILIALVALVGAGACSSDDAGGDRNQGPPSDQGGQNNNAGSGDWDDQNNDWSSDAGTTEDDDYVAEQEEDFEFSAPAVVGDQVYVANETLNSVAVIDSRNLSISTRLVGFRPTDIVGPDAARAEISDAARVMVLNEGSHSVSILATDAQATSDTPVKTVKVMANANQIAMEPTGKSAVVWYDPSEAESGDAAGDLSSVSVVHDGQSFQVSVGFHIRSVAFDDAGTRALILSDDGLSVIEFAEVDDDAIALPVAIVPAQFSSTQPEDLEVLTTPDGKWAITRSATFRGAVLLEVDSGALHFLLMPEVPTDIDLIEGDELEVLIMLRNAGKAVRATVPQGFRDAAEAVTTQASPVILGFTEDAGHDAAQSGADAGYDAGDVGYLEDVTEPDDAGNLDADSGGDAAMNPDASGSDEEFDFPSNINGFSVVDVLVDGMGAAVVSAAGNVALLYSTLNQEKRAVLYDLTVDPIDDGAQRALAFEKGVRGALSDRFGHTLLVFHSKLDGPVPPNTSPADPEYIAHSWGISVVDVASAATRLVLSQNEPGQAALYSPELDENGDSAEDAKIFMIFRAPLSAQDSDSAYRDVLTVNLRSFRTDSFRVPSVPEGLGLIRDAGRVYISQRHPQGRMTFVDVLNEKRQTITGYQLNAGID